MEIFPGRGNSWYSSAAARSCSSCMGGLLGHRSLLPNRTHTICLARAARTSEVPDRLRQRKSAVKPVPCPRGRKRSVRDATAREAGGDPLGGLADGGHAER